MLIKLFHFVCGYVAFVIVGEFPERLLNIFSKNSVTVWDIKRDRDKIYGKMSLSDYKRVHSIRKKCRVRTRALEKRGLPFLAKRYRHRIGFAVGLVAFFAILHTLSLFVWNIRVVGNNSIPAEKIIEVCYSLGIKEGIRRDSVDSDKTPSKIMLEVDGLSWVSLNVEGCILTVNVAERKDVEMTERMPSNLVASRDGIITNYVIDNGNILIRRGQAVKAGEILVSGILSNKDGSSRFVPSKGSVTAETEREISYFADFIQLQEVVSGKVRQKKVVKILGKSVPLYLGEYKGDYKTETEIKRFEFNKVYLPFEIFTKTFTPISEIAYEADTALATEIAREEVGKIAETELKDAEITESEETVTVTEGGVKVTVKYKCLENIAKQDLLLIYEE